MYTSSAAFQGGSGCRLSFAHFLVSVDRTCGTNWAGGAWEM